MVPVYRITTAAVIYDPQKGFLLGKRSHKEDTVPGLWSLPAGKLESGGPAEDVLEDNLRKEVWEEIGVEITDPKYFDSHMWTDKDPYKLTIVFTTQIASGEPKPMDPEEVSEVGWFKLKEIESLNLPPHVLRVLRKANKKTA
jgi:NADH pyrophosphatase NudC (nudix superfamily)